MGKKKHKKGKAPGNRGRSPQTNREVKPEPFQPEVLKPSAVTKAGAVILALFFLPIAAFLLFFSFEMPFSLQSLFVHLWGIVITLSLGHTFLHMWCYQLIRTEKSIIKKGLFTRREFPLSEMRGYEIYGKERYSRIVTKSGDRITSPYNRSFERIVGELKLRPICENSDLKQAPLVKWGTGLAIVPLFPSLFMTMHLLQLPHFIQFLTLIYPLLLYIIYTQLFSCNKIDEEQLQLVTGTALLFGGMSWVALAFNNDPNFSSLELMPAGTLFTVLFGLFIYKTVPRARLKMRESVNLVWLLGVVGFPLADLANQVLDSSKPQEFLCYVDEKWHTSGKGATANIRLSSSELNLNREEFSIHFNDYNRVREKSSIVIYRYRGRFGTPWFSLKKR